MVFAITQNFERSVPAEAQLYVLAQTPPGEPLPAALVSDTDRHLHQLLNRYILIKQQADSPGHPP
jgi:type VI secretion system protein VasL